MGELNDRNRRVWVLSDPDLLSNRGIAREGNAALVVTIVNRLRGARGNVVFQSPRSVR